MQQVIDAMERLLEEMRMDLDNGATRECPGLAEWPRPEDVACDHANCGKQCIVSEVQPGMSVAYFECMDRHITPLAASMFAASRWLEPFGVTVFLSVAGMLLWRVGKRSQR